MIVSSTMSSALLAEQENLSRARPYSPAMMQEALHHGAEEIRSPQRTAPTDIVEINGMDFDPASEDNIVDIEFDTPDARNISPREMGDLSLDLYIDGLLSFDEYSQLAFQSELHPEYEDTIGALTGEWAEPDEPRDFIREWEERKSFEQRYPTPDNGRTLAQIDRILGALHSLGASLEINA